MSETENSKQDQGAGRRQPIFLLPGVVAVLCGILLAVHGAASLFGPQALEQLTFWLGYIPLRIVVGFDHPGEWLPLLWTPVTHGLVHANWEHVLLNTVWLAVFGTPVARRYGSWPMVAIFAIAVVAGAAAFTLTSLRDNAFLIGASGGVAGLTGAAVRFIFQPVVVARHPETGEIVALGRRLASLHEVFANARARWFTIVWVALNAAVPLLPLLGGEDLAIAWQAHLGGFVAGLLIVPLFERRPGSSQSADG